MFRTFTIKDYKMYIDLFETYVFPIINYCSFLYFGTSVRNINELESILRYFTKRQYYRTKFRKTMLKVSYVDRLQIFSLKSIEHRLIVSEFCLFYKVIHGLIPLSSNDTIFSSRVPGRIRLSLSHTRIYHNFFLHRKRSLWNRLFPAGSNVQLSSFASFFKVVSELDLTGEYRGCALKAV